MDEQQMNENKTPSGDDITCSSCGSHNVRCRLSLWRKAAQNVLRRGQRLHSQRRCALLRNPASLSCAARVCRT